MSPLNIVWSSLLSEVGWDHCRAYCQHESVREVLRCSYHWDINYSLF